MNQNLLQVFPGRFPGISSRCSGESRDNGDPIYEECLRVFEEIQAYIPYGAHTIPEGHSGFYVTRTSDLRFSKPTPIVSYHEIGLDGEPRMGWKQIRPNIEAPSGSETVFYLHRARVDGDKRGDMRREYYIWAKKCEFCLCIIYPMNPHRRISKRTSSTQLRKDEVEETLNMTPLNSDKRRKALAASSFSSSSRTSRNSSESNVSERDPQVHLENSSIDSYSAVLSSQFFLPNSDLASRLPQGFDSSAFAALVYEIYSVIPPEIQLGLAHGNPNAFLQLIGFLSSLRVDASGYRLTPRVGSRTIRNAAVSVPFVDSSSTSEFLSPNLIPNIASALQDILQVRPNSSFSSSSGEDFLASVASKGNGHMDENGVVGKRYLVNPSTTSGLFSAPSGMADQTTDAISEDSRKRNSYGFSNSFPTDPMAVIGREHQVQSALNFIDNHFSSCRTTMCCIVIWGERGMGRTSFARHLAPAVADKFGLQSRQIYVNLRGEELDRDEEERTLYRKDIEALHQILFQLDEETAIRFAASKDLELVRRECHRMLLVRRPENQHILLIDNVSHIRQIESLVPLRFRGNDMYPPLTILISSGDQTCDVLKLPETNTFDIFLGRLHDREAGDFLRNLLAKFDSMGSSLSSNSTLLSNTNDCVFSEIVNACQGHPLRLQTIVGWISLQIQSGTVQSISEAWKLFTSLVNTQSSPAHTSSRDWLGSILETLSPLHKSILHCLVLFNGKVSIGFPMLVSLLTGALHSVEKAFGSLALDRNEVFSKNSVPEIGSNRELLQWIENVEREHKKQRKLDKMWTKNDIECALRELAQMNIITLWKEKHSQLPFVDQVDLDLFERNQEHNTYSYDNLHSSRDPSFETARRLRQQSIRNERRYLRPMHLPFLADEEELDPPPSRFEGHNTNSRRSLQKVSQNGNDSLSASHSSHVTDADNMFGGDEEDDDFGAEDILQQGQHFPSGTDKDDAIDRIEKGNIPKKIIDSSGEGFQPFSTPGLEHKRDRLSARLQPDSEYSQYFVDTSQVAFDPSVAFYYRSSHWEREDFMDNLLSSSNIVYSTLCDEHNETDFSGIFHSSHSLSDMYLENSNSAFGFHPEPVEHEDSFHLEDVQDESMANSISIDSFSFRDLLPSSSLDPKVTLEGTTWKNSSRYVLSGGPVRLCSSSEAYSAIVPGPPPGHISPVSSAQRSAEPRFSAEDCWVASSDSSHRTIDSTKCQYSSAASDLERIDTGSANPISRNREPLTVGGIVLRLPGMDEHADEDDEDEGSESFSESGKEDQVCGEDVSLPEESYVELPNRDCDTSLPPNVSFARSETESIAVPSENGILQRRSLLDSPSLKDSTIGNRKRRDANQSFGFGQKKPIKDFSKVGVKALRALDHFSHRLSKKESFVESYTSEVDNVSFSRSKLHGFSHSTRDSSQLDASDQHPLHVSNSMHGSSSCVLEEKSSNSSFKPPLRNGSSSSISSSIFSGISFGGPSQSLIESSSALRTSTGIFAPDILLSVPLQSSSMFDPESVVMCDLQGVFSSYIRENWDLRWELLFEIRFIRYMGVWLRKLQNAYYRDVLSSQAALAFEYRRKYVRILSQLLQRKWPVYFLHTVPDLIHGLDFFIGRYSSISLWRTLRAMCITYCREVVPDDFLFKSVHDLSERKQRLRQRHAKIIQKAVILCRWTGDSRRAMRLGDMLRESQSYLQPGSLPYIRNQNTYASLLLDQGKFSEAEELMWDLLESLRTAERSARADYVAARILQKLALICNIQGKYQQAKVLYRETLSLRASLVGKEHPGYLKSLFLYSNLLMDIGETEEAKENYKRCLDLWRTVLVSRPVETAAVEGNLGSVYRFQGKYEKALERFEESLKYYLEFFSAQDTSSCSHIELARGYSHIGTMLEMLGRFDESEHKFRIAFSFFDAQPDDSDHVFCVSPDHLSSAPSSSDPSQTSIDRNVYSSLFRTNADIYQDDYSILLDNYGVLCHQRGDFISALEYQRKSLSIRERMFGPRHPSVATSLNNIACSLDAIGNHAESIKLLQKSLEIRLRSYGASDCRVSRPLHNMAISLMTQQVWDGVEELFLRTMDLWNNAMLGTNQLERHAELGPSYNNLGVLCCFRQRFNDSFEYLYEALQIVSQRHGLDCHMCSVVRNNLGVACEQRGLLPEALDHYLRALKIRVANGQFSHPHFALSLCNLARLSARVWESEHVRFCELLAMLPFRSRTISHLSRIDEMVQLLSSTSPADQKIGRDIASSIPCIPIYLFTFGRWAHSCGRSTCD